MYYVEFLRVRKALLLYSIVLAVTALIIAFSLHSATLHHSGNDLSVTIGPGASGTSAKDALHQSGVPFVMLAGIAGFVAMIFATILGANLNKENQGGYAFTKPVARERLGFENVCIDIAGILTAYVVAVLCGILVLASAGMLSQLYLDPTAITVVWLSLGASVMWYGLLQAATAGYRGSGGRIVGFSWGLFFTLLLLVSFTSFGPLFHDVILALNTLNPLAYFGGISIEDSHQATAHSIFTISASARAGITWAIGLCACAAAIFAWKRVEV